VGVIQQWIGNSPLNALSSLSGNGSKKLSGMSYWASQASPTGRDSLRAWGKGTICATGTLRRQICTVSPASTAARYSESLALASWMLMFNMAGSCP